MATHLEHPLASVLRPTPTDVICWEALKPRGKVLRQARRIYKSSLPEEERIPWRWIKEGLDGERAWDPARWSRHLILAGLRRPEGEGRRVLGFAYGAHVPGFGGYGAYLAVDPRARGHGVGARLWRLLIQRLQLDAACAGVALPFVVWESRLPAAGTSGKDREVWQARLRLWQRLGAARIEGVRFLTPNCAERHGPPVPLQLFLKPMDMPAARFDAKTLRAVVVGLHQRVYGLEPDDPLVASTLTPQCRPMLRAICAER